MPRGVKLYDFLTPIRPGQRGSLAAQIAAQLRGGIVSLRLPPGTLLDKTEICNRTGISRSPVAEAFARLQAEGLIDILPQRGSIVSYVSIATVKEYIFIRKALEGEAVRALAQSHRKAFANALRANIAAQNECARTNDPEAFHRLDQEFHQHLTGALAFHRMKALVDTARNNLDRARHMTDSPRRIAEGIEEHTAIAIAVTDGDGEAAARFMHAHLDRIVEEVEALAARQPELFVEQSPFAHRLPGPAIAIRRLPTA